jgi:lipid-binding SYLF domain-containing protein
MNKLVSLVLSGALVLALGGQLHSSSKDQAASSTSDQAAAPEKGKADDSKESKEHKEVVDRLQSSSNVLTELMSSKDSSVPEWVLSKAHCVMVIPSMIKGGFIFGGRHGRGAATCKNNGRWSAPQMMTISGGSWGAQIGGEAVDLVLIFVGNKGAEQLLKDNVKISGDLSVAAGPFGRSAQASTDVSIRAEILAYSKARGLFAGAELGGASVRSDDDSDTALYGRKTTSEEVLSGKVPAPAEAEPFVNTVRKVFREAVNAH